MTIEAGAPPSIFLHTQAVYQRMMQQAQREQIDDTQIGMVYSGHMTKLIMGPPLNLPIPYYTQITRALTGMGCAQQLKRGGGSSPSRWALFQEPTLEVFQRWTAATESDNAKARSKTAQNEQMIRDLEARVSSLETAFEEFIAAMGE